MAVLLNDLEEIDREWDMERESRMLELRKSHPLNPTDARLLDGNRIDRLSWINMTKEQRLTLLCEELGIEHVPSQWCPMRMEGDVTLEGG